MSGAALSPAGAVSVAEIWSRTTALPKGRVQPIRASNFGFLDELTQECVGAADVRRLVVLPIAPTDNPSEWIDELVAGLTGLLEASWPVWFGNHDFGWLRGDALGRERLRETVRDLVAGDERISPAWLKRAVRLLSNGRRLAAASVDPSIQIEQACIALSPPGIVLFLALRFCLPNGTSDGRRAGCRMGGATRRCGGCSGTSGALAGYLSGRPPPVQRVANLGCDRSLEHIANSAVGPRGGVRQHLWTRQAGDQRRFRAAASP
jgi:hypothetical protein